MFEEDKPLLGRGQAKSTPLNIDQLLNRKIDPRIMWLGGVEHETAEFRDQKAREHFARGKELQQERMNVGQLEAANAGALWHRQRGFAHLYRFERTYDCGLDPYWVVCTECDRSKEKTKRCGFGLLCLTCRAMRAAEKRMHFSRARKRAMSRMRAKGLDHPRRPGGAFGERLLTLTVPHHESFGVQARVAVAFEAWRLLLKSLNRHLRAKGAAADAQLFRVFEWTPGDDGLGHPHFHVWLLSPFIEQATLQHWWECALRTAGMPVTVAIVDIRRAYGLDGGAKEIIKYLTKDILPDQRQVDAATFAELYKAVHGRRITQASAGFFKGIDRRAECECGAVGCFKRVVQPPAKPAAISVDSEAQRFMNDVSVAARAEFRSVD